MKPHWSYSPGISPAAQEDAAREREDERTDDAVFDTFRAAVIDTIKMDLRQHEGESYEAAGRRVVNRIEEVIRRPHGWFGTEREWAQFADDYGPEQLRRCFVKALASPAHELIDTVTYE